ncbi:hypothetical protein [Sinorhizobium saheli]|uniref:hypothetical protein n=1 Tax=Sinorhizobium saheli TaxID=36856 RepID=UPI002E0DCDAE
MVIAFVTEHSVIAFAGRDGVVPESAVDPVIAGGIDKQIVTITAQEAVVTRTTTDYHCRSSL